MHTWNKTNHVNLENVALNKYGKLSKLDPKIHVRL